jgi:hypothetical protein
MIRSKPEQRQPKQLDAARQMAHLPGRIVIEEADGLSGNPLKQAL